MSVNEEKYTGSITLGSEYGENSGKQVEFELVLERDGDKFTGKCLDTGGIAPHPEAAQVVGKFELDRIRFVKQYPSLHYYQKGLVEDKRRKGPEINYTGKLDRKTNEFIGSWEIPEKKKFFGLITVIRQSSGTWSMKKRIP